MQVHRRYYWYIVGFVCCSLGLFAQSGNITGRVIDAKTKTVLPSATVLLVEADKAGSAAQKAGKISMGRVADKTGHFNFNDVPVGTYVLRASYLSYATLERKVTVLKGETATVEMALQLDVKGLNEVVVTGVASRTEKAVSEVAVSRVDAGALTESNSFQDLNQLLAGKVSGVRMSTGSGAAGTGFRFDVRSGAGLNGAGQPIVYVDGVRVNQDYFDAGVGGQEQSALSVLDPESIESIEILKGPAAAALYGTVGANGVVLIKTKHGSRNAAPGSYTLQVKKTIGSNEQARPYTRDMILSYQDANRVFPDHVLGNGSRETERGLSSSAPTRIAGISETSISFGGSNSLCNYFIGYSSRDENGLLVTNNYNRESIHANFSVFPSEKLALSLSTNYTFNNTTLPISDNSVLGLLGATTISAPKSAGGLGSYLQIDSMAIVSIANKQRERRFIASIEANYALMTDVNVRAVLGYDGSQFRYDQYFPYDQDYSGVGIKNGSRFAQQNGSDRVNFDLSGAYTWKIDDEMRLVSTIGVQGNTVTSRSLSFQKDSLPSTLITDAGSGSKFVSAGEGFVDSRQAGVFLQEEFSYDNTYFASAGLRNDYASAIGIDAPSIFYPRISAAARLDKVFSLPATMNLAKFRVAYGESGSLPGLLDGSLLRWKAQNSGEGPGAVIDFLGNPAIKPERIKEMEIGFEVELDHSYGIDFTYYMQTANNSIFNVVLPPSVGIPNVRRNVGAIDGSGIESNIYARLYRSEDYQLEVNFIWNYSTNQVTDLGTAPPIISEPNVAFVGQPRGAFYTNAIIGALYDSTGHYLKANVDTSKRTYLGNPVPPTNGSFNLNFRFLHDFTFYALADWALGGTIYNFSKQFASSFGNNAEYNHLHALLGIPVKAGDFIPRDTITVPLTPGTAEYKAAADEFAKMDPTLPGATKYFESSDFLRIREISIRWDATSLIQSVIQDYVKSLSITVGGRNLAMWTKYSFPDPEVSTNGARVTISRGNDFITLQNPRVLYATVSVGF